MTVILTSLWSYRWSAPRDRRLLDTAAEMARRDYCRHRRAWHARIVPRARFRH